MSTTLHKDLAGADLHVNKIHADTHVVAGTDPLVLAESQVADLISDLADKVATDDSRLSDARVASDVSAWAKAGTKPSYTNPEVGAAAAVHGHVKADITDFPILIPGTGNGDVVGPVSATPGNLATFADDTGKNIQDGGAVPTTLPASDVSAWAKEAIKPAYTPAEIGSPSGSGDSSGSNTGDQTLSGLGAEAVANKSVSVPTDAASDTKYPSVKAVKDYADGLVAGLLDYRGAYDASGNAYPTTGGSGTAGAVMKGDMWAISVAGTLGGVAIQVGDAIIAKIDTPAQTAGDWNTLNTNVSYVPEDQANKENTTLDVSTVKYPTNNLVKTELDGKVGTGDARLSDARVASDVSAWAKAGTKPTYASSEITNISAAGQELINDADAAAQRATLGGVVVGPTSATDNAIVRFDAATGKLVQNSPVVISDDGNTVITGVNASANGPVMCTVVNTDAGSTVMAGIKMKTGITTDQWQAFTVNDQFKIGIADVEDTVVITKGAGGSFWTIGNMSALSITDRTPVFEGDAVAELIKVKGIAGKIDHSTLPVFARHVTKLQVASETEKDADGTAVMVETQEEGRDLGAMISMLTVAIKQLNDRLLAVEEKG